MTNLIALLVVSIGLWANVFDVRLMTVRMGYGALALGLCGLCLLQRFRVWQATRRSGLNWRLPWPARGIASATELLVSCATLLLAIEAGARALPPLINSSLIHPAHRFIWPEAYAGRNRWGLNDVNHKIKDGLRVLVLGDSYIEGAGVRRGERLTSVLQTRLKPSAPHATVIAGGECGWDTTDELHLLQRIGDEAKPDVVILGYVLNDAEGGRSSSDQPAAWEQWLLLRARSYAYYRIYRWKKPGPDAYWSRIEREHAANAPGWIRTQQALREIHDWCEQRQIPHALFVLPIFNDTAERGRPTMDQVVQTARDQGWPAFSTLDDFEGRWADFAISPDDAHPNPAGHQRLAERFANWLQTVRK